MIDKEQTETKMHQPVNFEKKKEIEIGHENYQEVLSSKKHIVEYIDHIKQLSKEKISEKQAKEAYLFIEEQIEKMKATIKPNTILQLKKELNTKLGKFAPKKQNQQGNHFLRFFTEAYPKNKRYKEFTWVLMDLSRISDEQILHTLKYINAWCLKNKLNASEKRDIIEQTEKLVAKGNLKYINQVKSLEGLNKGLGIKIIDAGGQFNVSVIKK